jgi:trk system potassium uptake protein TrkA
MRIIIAGAGAVGRHLAKLLSREDMDISLIDERQDRLGDLDANYDLLTKVGSPTSINDLKSIGVEDVDLFIAVTPSESDNITSCLLANELGAKKTLARIDNYEYLRPENKHIFEKMGLNHLIYPELLAAQEITASLKTNWMRYHMTLCEGTLELCVVKVREGAEVVGKKFISGYFNHGLYRIVAIKRGQTTIIPGGQDEVMADDMVYAVCTKENKKILREQLGKQKREINNIVFFGGSKIAQKTVQNLPDDMNIKILEADRDLCFQLSEKINNALIINADGSDMAVLKDEGIEDADAFVAVTDSSEANIFACMAAKRFGVKKTIAEIENIDYISMAESMDIGSVINKKKIAASTIFQMLLNTDVLSVKCLTFIEAVVAEFPVSEGCYITKKPVKNLGLPDGANIGGLIRNGDGMHVTGNTMIQAGDHVIIFCREHVLKKLEKFFK